MSTLVTEPAFHISPGDTLAATARLMRSENVSAVLVGPGVTGIVTERDLTRALANGCSPQASVAEVRTPLPITVQAGTDILEAASLMLNQEVRHLVVELHDGSVGIVSLRTIAAVLLQAAQPQLWLSTLRVQLGIREPR